MTLTAILLRWYRSFNTTTLGPGDPDPPERWNRFRDEAFPFVVVPIDSRITSVVGANESGKSHLLAAVSKVIHGTGLFGISPDPYEIKDICRYCGFSALDEVWPEIGIQLRLTSSEAAVFEQRDDSGDQPTSTSTPNGEKTTVTIILNGGNPGKFATVYRGDALVTTFARDEWTKFAENHLPGVEVLDADLALPNEVYIDELIDIYNAEEAKPVVDPLAVQALWRAIGPVSIAADPAGIERLKALHQRIAESTRAPIKDEQKLVHLFFADALGVSLKDLNRMKKYTRSERGYVSWMNDDINDRIDRELDIARYWDQDEDFKLSVNYKGGTFHFQITDRTGSTYTFNERSSGLRYFLSYYIQAKALEKRFADKGVIILMDEPDNFLSASGQRSLLRVFEELVDKRTASGSCQLIYTTHSPFLINRNFPDRVRLVRKGDGSEGTQYVPRAAVRRFEPVRTALSIDSADTIFLGSTNVVLEGFSDLKLIIACIQRFGEPGSLDEMLDLNAVTFVAAGGAPHAAGLVRKAFRGDEKPPIVVVLLDGDASGMKAAGDVAGLIDPKQVSTLREVDAGTRVFEVLEDIVPAEILDAAIHAYAERLKLVCTGSFMGSTGAENQAKQLVQFAKANVTGLDGYEDIEIRAGVIDSLVEMLGDESFQRPALADLRTNIKQICAHLNGMIEHAQRQAHQRSLRSLVRQHVQTFIKRFPKGAHKGDARKLLNDIKQSAFGRTEDFERARSNVDSLLGLLEKEARANADPIRLELWRARLDRFKNEPWAKNPKWSEVREPVAVTPAKPSERPAEEPPPPTIQ